MKTPPSQRVRVTVPVTPDTLEAFQHYADAAGISVGRAMGDWLRDQVSAVTYVAVQLEAVHEAPREIALQLVPAAARMDAESAGERPAAAAAGPEAPRPVIRGGKSPRQGAK